MPSNKGKRKNSNKGKKPAAKAAAAAPAKVDYPENGYGWKEVGKDLLTGNYLGNYGGCNTAWHALAAIRANTDLKKYHTKRSPDEFFLDSLDSHMKNPNTQRRWGSIATLDPMGLYGSPPTMSATEACMEIPEIQAQLVPDGKIVNADGSVNIQKCAVDYVWNMPAFAKKVKLPEQEMREKLAEYTCNPSMLDESKKTYLPPLGGATCYFFGDLTKLGKPETEVAVRVHDSCCGSDVFGTDICTCRPYLVFAIQAAIECAQRGGVGLIVYFQKEGRGLGEVTKYRVYNARKNQKGGDTSETYFHQTESIAGIQDARFQEMMPDVLLWLGIERIDWLLSMSSEKYDAITEAGIKVMQRVSIPDSYIPKNAHVEINAKIAAGYHSSGPTDDNVIVAELRTLEMVRKRCGQIMALATADKSRHFKLDLSKLPATVDFVLDVTKKNYPDLKVPYHSRWRHFHEGDLKEMEDAWRCDEIEKVRRLIDLATVSVLIDAGAGANWKYIDGRGEATGRSEGLALASMDMFREGAFSSDVAIPGRVNAHGIKQMTLLQFRKGFQVHDTNNPLLGIDGRYELLQRLADVMLAKPEFFGGELARPGNMVDYVLKQAEGKKVSLKVLWKVVIEGLEDIWPSSTSGVACTNLNPAGFTGTKRGDVWIYSPLKHFGKTGSDMIPFHKLSQWLTYSLLEPFEKLGIHFDDLELMTGLPEYRNGGLFVDMGVLQIRDIEGTQNKEFDAGSELIVEWRALTLCLLDLVGEQAAKKLGKTSKEFPLARVLQGGTWAAGRIIAAQKRPDTKAPPIKLRSTGAVF